MTPNGIYGHGYYSKGGIDDAALGKATYVYPNGQEAAPIWFHDHMLGATRLNVYAGIAGGYVVTEPANTYAPGLHPLGLSNKNTGELTEPTVPLIIQDRMFDTTGQLFFPNLGINPENPFWVPEFVGDTIVVNGKVWPFKVVDRQRYTLFFLNGSNARFYKDVRRHPRRAREARAGPDRQVRRRVRGQGVRGQRHEVGNPCRADRDRAVVDLGESGSGAGDVDVE